MKGQIVLENKLVVGKEYWVEFTGEDWNSGATCVFKYIYKDNELVFIDENGVWFTS